MVLKIAVTGNIAAGKSLAEKILKDNGFKVFDTDLIAHEILEEKFSELVNAFAGYDIEFEGKISRKKLGALVFEDKKLKNILENIVHPMVIEKLNKIFYQNSNEKVIFVSVPLLFEAEMQYMFDRLVLIYADDNIRLKRLMKRNSLTEKEALNRMLAQIPQENKRATCDFVLENNGSEFDLSAKISEMIKNINILDN